MTQTRSHQHRCWLIDQGCFILAPVYKLEQMVESLKSHFASLHYLPGPYVFCCDGKLRKKGSLLDQTNVKKYYRVFINTYSTLATQEILSNTPTGVMVVAQWPIVSLLIDISLDDVRGDIIYGQ